MPTLFPYTTLSRSRRHAFHVQDRTMIDPLTKGKIRAGREQGRVTEDDVAREREGEQGTPGKAKPQVMDDDKLQNPKPIDPGHTA